jgi:hypothetical protein
MAKVYLILALAKKHLFSLICLVVAGGAAGSIFYFNGWYADLRDRVSARQSVYQHLTSLATKARTLPIVDPDSNTTDPLKRFPTDPIIKAGEDVTANVALDSAGMLKFADDLDKHDVLLPGILPNNPSQSMGVKFQQVYAAAIDYMTPDHRDASMPGRLLKGGTPPTAAEIQQRRVDIQNDLTAKMQYVNGKFSSKSPTSRRRSPTICVPMRRGSTRFISTTARSSSPTTLPARPRRKQRRFSTRRSDSGWFRTCWGL